MDNGLLTGFVFADGNKLTKPRLRRAAGVE